MYESILGYKVFSGTKDELYEEVQKYGKSHIISGNSEILYRGLKDKGLDKIYKAKESIIIADGVGTIFASKLLGTPIKEKIAGIEFMEYIINKSIADNVGIYLLGGTQNVVEKCSERLKYLYKGINIMGYHNGYFDINKCNEIINEINSLNVGVVFIAMGCPRQEEFVEKYKEKINSNIFMGVGGSFDIFAGEIKRAPKIFIKLNLEWLYRVIKEPKRIVRLRFIPLFLSLVFREKKGLK